MAKYFGDACISDGEYEKDGQKKKRWMKIGSVFQQEDSGSLSVYLPLFDRWVNIFPKQEQQVTKNNIGQQFQQRNPMPEQPPKDDSDELPF